MTPFVQTSSSSQPWAARALCRRMRAMRRAAVWLLVLVVGGSRAVAHGQEQGSVVNREYAIKAAFLYHFSTYIQWPREAEDAADRPFVIGVYRENPFGSSLARIAEKKTVDGRPIDIRRITSLKEARQCQILFVPSFVTPASQDAVLRATRNSHVLVVGETNNFVQQGGDAQFFLEGNRVRFAFSATTAKREDLKVSSKLLALAEIIPSP
jgi:hypothetical protein